MFCELGLKMPIHAPRSGFFLNLTNKVEAVFMQPPTGTFLRGSKDVQSKSVYQCGLSVIPRIKLKRSPKGSFTPDASRCITTSSSAT